MERSSGRRSVELTPRSKELGAMEHEDDRIPGVASQLNACGEASAFLD
jgi:hypothetical protein